jgi:penicillin-binding protein 2
LGKLSPNELTNLRPQGYGPADSIGKTGIEKNYEAELRGTFGRKKIEVDAAGKEQNILAVDPPKPGKDLYLSIDLEAQHVLEQLVKASADATHKERYAAVAMDPRNGEISAMVSWPTYNNNDFSGGISSAAYKTYIDNKNRPLFNRAIAGLYPPGSTAKLMVAAAALQEGVATVNTTVNSVGGLQVGNRYFKDWKAGGHGITNVVRALAWSVNTYFYYVGGGYEKFVGLGVERLTKYFAMFKLDTRTGIDLPGEPSGFIPSPSWKQATEHERWYVGDTYNISIGQGGLLVSPLTVARWTAAAATGGSLVTPHVAKTFVDPDTKQSNELKYPHEQITTISQQNFAIVRSGMRECVKSGSCQLLNGLPFASGGKTGTAQWSNSHPTHAWFTSFAPFDNPKIVVTVLVEDGGEGSQVAMPIAKNFLAWWGQKYLK